MASKLKLHISKRILDALKDYNVQESAAVALSNLVTIGSSNTTELHLSHLDLQKCLCIPKEKTIDVELWKKYFIDDKILNVENIHEKKCCKYSFIINKNLFIKEILSDIVFNPYSYKKRREILNKYRDRKVIVEFSSPNIAKPFHIGHLRSTIIGNFISKLHEYLAFDVSKVNYIGDWGTQFGFLQVGLEISNFSDDMVKNNPIELLYQAYVTAHKEAEKNPELIASAKEVMVQMESGNLQYLEKWDIYRSFTMDELQKTYKRLQISFDEYSWESMYKSQDIKKVFDLLNEKKLLKTNENGKVTTQLNNERIVTLVKSDGSSLYLTRDIAAAIDRQERYNFNKMLYVVENAQSDHFLALFEILKKMNFTWAQNLHHVKFGRVHGMSTRKGNVVFLKDILNEARSITKERQDQSPTTKEDLPEETSDILGVSAVIVNDLKQRRLKDYEFNWNKVLQVQGDTGIRLQYTHCRLWSLEKNSRSILPSECDPSVLEEPEALHLVQHIARFEEVLHQSYQELEACILVQYLFQLCNSASRALKVLPVKYQDPHIASQRLLLFHATRLILNQGMRILGLQPLQEM